MAGLGYLPQLIDSLALAAQRGSNTSRMHAVNHHHHADAAIEDAIHFRVSDTTLLLKP